MLFVGNGRKEFAVAFMDAQLDGEFVTIVAWSRQPISLILLPERLLLAACLDFVRFLRFLHFWSRFFGI